MMNRPWQARRLPSVSSTRIALFRTCAILIGLVIAGGVLKLAGFEPIALSADALSYTFGTAYGLQGLGTLVTPLILTGLAVSLAMRIQLWNMGADGQFYLGAWAAAGVGIFFDGPPALMLCLMLLAGAVGGALWVAIPAYARAKANVNEIISTLMLNFVAVLFVSYFATGPWKEPTMATMPSSMPILYALPNWFGTLNIGIFIALALVFAVWLVLQRTVWGYEMTVNGANREVARSIGINVDRQLIATMLFSGAVAGVAGAIEVSGTVTRLAVGISNQYGYLGIIVAVLARGRIVGVILSALFLAVLVNCGITLETQGLSLNAVIALTGFLLMLVAVADVAAQYRIIPIGNGARP